MSLDFKVEASVENREIHTIINGRRYWYFIDAAHYQRFMHLYVTAPGKALNFIKKIAKEVRRL